MNPRRIVCLAVCFLFACLPLTDAFRRQKLNHTHNNITFADAEEEDMPRVHYLLEMIGKEIYASVNKKKYKFYIYMTVGTLPSEKSTILFISTICNTLYCLSILMGFLFFKRGPMLTFTILTLWIGPALVLILLGTVGIALAAFALYPLASVFVMTLWFFLTSQLAQTLGKKYGLDSDDDGDVDMLDLLHFLANTEIGSTLGLGKLHAVLNQCTGDPFQEIHRRLDRIHRSTELNSQRLLNAEGGPASNGEQGGKSVQKKKV